MNLHSQIDFNRNYVAFTKLDIKTTKCEERHRHSHFESLLLKIVIYILIVLNFRCSLLTFDHTTTYGIQHLNMAWCQVLFSYPSQIFTMLSSYPQSSS